ncbi:MAG: hypothetical protein DRP90_00150 [Planctomycetota bacterium]|nr:MAG: hypothetical protein DRP90_00150 [Planctomycetota bacterium]
MLSARKAALLSLVLLVAALAAVSAEVKVKADRAADLLSERENTLDVSFEEFTLADVVQYLAEKGGVNIVIDPKSDLATLKVSADLKGVTWLQVLNYLAEKYEFDIETSETGVYYLRQPKRIDLMADNAPLREVIRQIAEDAGFNLYVDPDVEGKVTAYLKDVPWTHALDVILKHSPFVMLKERYNTIVITTVEKLKEKPETRIFRLNYIEPVGQKYVPELETKYASKEEAKAIQPSSLLDIVQDIVGKEGFVKYETTNNALIVRASRKVLAEVEQLITDLDREPLQVSISVRIYSVSLEQVRDVGIKWSEGLIFSGNGGSATNAVVFPFTRGFDSWEKYLHGASTRGPFFTADPVITGGSLDASQLAMTLKLLDTYTNAEVIQQPRITTLDNHAATIHIGDVIRYAEYEQSTGGDTTTGGYKEAENSPVELGVQLLVIPHVARRERNILMTVIPKIEDARSGALFEEFGAGGTAIKLPQTKTELVVSKMIIPDGNTGVLAGFVKNTNSKSGNKIPLLGDIPLLGWLFKNRHSENKKEVLLIFITPTVISSTSTAEVTKEFETIRKSLHDEFLRKQKEVVEKKVKKGETKVKPSVD